MNSTEQTAEHPYFPLHATVRNRMHNARGVVILSRDNAVSVRWAQPATYVQTFDGWQARNNLVRLAS